MNATQAAQEGWTEWNKLGCPPELHPSDVIEYSTQLGGGTIHTAKVSDLVWFSPGNFTTRYRLFPPAFSNTTPDRPRNLEELIDYTVKNFQRIDKVLKGMLHAQPGDITEPKKRGAL